MKVPATPRLTHRLKHSWVSWHHPPPVIHPRATCKFCLNEQLCCVDAAMMSFICVKYVCTNKELVCHRHFLTVINQQPLVRPVLHARSEVVSCSSSEKHAEFVKLSTGRCFVPNYSSPGASPFRHLATGSSTRNRCARRSRPSCPWTRRWIKSSAGSLSVEHPQHRLCKYVRQERDRPCRTAWWAQWRGALSFDHAGRRAPATYSMTQSDADRHAEGTVAVM